MNADRVIFEMSQLTEFISVHFGISFRTMEYRTDPPFTPKTAIKLNCGSHSLRNNVGVVVTAIEATTVDEHHTGQYDDVQVAQLLADMKTAAYWAPVLDQLHMVDDEQTADLRARLLQEARQLRAAQVSHFHISRAILLPVQSLETAKIIQQIPDHALGEVLASILPTLTQEWRKLIDAGLDIDDAALLLRSKVERQLHEDAERQSKYPQP